MLFKRLGRCLPAEGLSRTSVKGERHGLEVSCRVLLEVGPFHQTMAREWGYGLLYASSEHRRRTLPYLLAYYYNEQRPHSTLGGRSPISRVHDVSGQDS